MSTYLHDPINTAVRAQAIGSRAITQTVTGTYQDMITGDGRVMLLTDVVATSMTSIIFKVQQSTLTNSGFADITGASVTATTTGITGFTFDRDSRYLLVIATFSGTTAFASAVLSEQLKTF